MERGDLSQDAQESCVASQIADPHGTDAEQSLFPGDLRRMSLDMAQCDPWAQSRCRAEARQARLPWLKTLEQFDFSFQPSIDRKVVRELSTLGFAERAENVVLLGPPGVGKTHLAIGLAIKAAQVGHRVLFLTLEQLMGKLKRASQETVWSASCSS